MSEDHPMQTASCRCPKRRLRCMTPTVSVVPENGTVRLHKECENGLARIHGGRATRLPGRCQPLMAGSSEHLARRHIKSVVSRPSLIVVDLGTPRVRLYGLAKPEVIPRSPSHVR